MIVFKRLRAQNAGCFKELDVPLNKQGDVLIVGENRDEPKTSEGRWHSNGSGKSTIPELLTHALKQTASKPEFRKNGIINLFHPKDCFIEVEFDTGGHEYTVRQYRKHTNHGTSLKLFKDGTDISCQGTRAIPDTQELLDSILDLTLGEWYGFVYLAQRHTHSMVEGKPSEKREYLSRVFSLDVIDDYDERLKKFVGSVADKMERMTSLEERKSALRKELRELAEETFPANLDELLSGARKKLSTAQTHVANAKAATKRTDVAKRLLTAGHFKSEELTGSGFDNSLEKLRKRLKEDLRAGIAAKSATDQRTSLKSKLRADLPEEKDVRSKLKDYSDRLANLTEASKLSLRIASLDAKLASSKVKGSDSELTELSHKLVKTLKRKKAAEERLAVVKSELKRLQALDGHQACPTCMQTVKVEHVAELTSKRDTEKTTLSGSVKDLSDKADDLSHQISDLEAYVRVSTQRSEAAKEMPQGYANVDVGAEAKRISAKQTALQDVLVDLKRQAQIEAELSKLPVVVKSLTDEEISKLQADLDLLTEARAHDWSIPILDVRKQRKIRDRSQKTADKLTRKCARRDHFDVTKNKLEDELKEIRADLLKLEGISSKHHIASTMRLALRDLKTTRLKEATRVLTDILPSYVSSLFPGKNVKIRIDDRKADSFDLLFEKGGKIIPLGSLSGGQGKKLAIAVVLAFTQLASKRVNLLFADEPYSALDRPSRRIADDLIHEAGVSSTFLMSHDTELLARRFDQRWRCIMRDNVSVLKRSRLRGV